MLVSANNKVSSRNQILPSLEARNLLRSFYRSLGLSYQSSGADIGVLKPGSSCIEGTLALTSIRDDNISSLSDVSYQRY